MLDLPPETWITIVALGLSRSDIANVSLLSRRFLMIAQPLLFTSVNFYACSFRKSVDSYAVFTPLSIDERKTLYDKLSFCCSPGIAPQLKRCAIGLPPGQITGVIESSTTRPILDDIFSILPYLVNIKMISLHDIEITSFLLSQMQAMVSLTSVTFTACYSTITEPLNLALSEVVISDGDGPGRLLTLSWAHLLKPAHLRSLHAPTFHVTDLIPKLISLGPWPALRQLTLTAEIEALLSSPRFLYHCPQLEELYIHSLFGQSSWPPAVHSMFFTPPDCVLGLTTYCGPPITVPAAMAGRAIRHLGIIPGVSASEIERTLTGLGDACALLETFQVSIYSLSLLSGIIPIIVEQCYNVRTFHFLAYGKDSLPMTWTPAGLQQPSYTAHFLAHAQFPPRVETVYIRIKPPVHEVLQPEEERALRTLAASYSALRDFAFMLGDETVGLHFNPATGEIIDDNRVYLSQGMQLRGF